MEFTDRQRLHILRCVGLGNMSYSETAASLNEKYGIDASAEQVGDERRAMTSEANSVGLETYHGELVRQGLMDDLNNILRGL